MIGPAHHVIRELSFAEAQRGIFVSWAEQEQVQGYVNNYFVKK